MFLALKGLSTDSCRRLGGYFNEAKEADNAYTYSVGEHLY